MPPQRFSTFPVPAHVGAPQVVLYDSNGATLPLTVKVTYNPNKGGFSTVLYSPGQTIPVTPPSGCTSVTFEDLSQQSQAYTLPVV